MRKFLLMFLLLLCALPPLHAADRFPRPEFESDYVRPQTTTPAPRADYFEYIDVSLLVLALIAAVWLVHKKRSRKGTLILAALCLIYFGFIRQGCVCSVGSIQNVSLALFSSGYAIPITVLAFFLLPLIAALFFGRVFCSSVCPLGAAQEVVLLSSVKIPPVIDRLLRFLPWFFLGASILYAATNTAFLICEQDPFVPFFHLSGESTALIAGAVILATSTIIGRPYCRYVCPYGALLSVCSRLSWKRVSITPDECIKCRLCEDACPYGAINPPQQQRLGKTLSRERLILLTLLILLPFLAAAGAWTGDHYSSKFAQRNTIVQHAEIVRASLARQTLSKDQREIAEAFFQTREAPGKLYEQARQIKQQFSTGSTILGGFLGLLVGLALIRLSLRRRQEGYEADRGNCLACGRCYSACPREIALRKTVCTNKESMSK